jgi:hypothetical protein
VKAGEKWKAEEEWRVLVMEKRQLVEEVEEDVRGSSS